MKVSGHSMRSGYSHQARTLLDDSQLIHESGVPCHGDVYVTQTFIEYGTETECHRPKIVLTGRLRNLKGEFPNGIYNIEFEESDQPDVTLYYELSNKQIARMYEENIFPDLDELKEFIEQKANGYISYPETIVTPDIMNGNVYEDIPMECSYVLVKDTRVPIIFVQPDSQYNIDTNEAMSGYDLVEYLEQFKRTDVKYEDFEKAVEDDSLDYEEDFDEDYAAENEVDAEFEDDSVAHDIFKKTKPIVDEHIMKDKAHIEEVNSIVDNMNLDEYDDDEEYDSEFARMMAEGDTSYVDDEDAPVDDESEEKAQVSDGPLSIAKIMERRKKEAIAKQNAARQNEELNKKMPTNLDSIQDNGQDTEDDKQDGLGE